MGERGSVASKTDCLSLSKVLTRSSLSLRSAMVSRREDGPPRGLRSTTDEISDRVSGLRTFPYIHTVFGEQLFNNFVECSTAFSFGFHKLQKRNQRYAFANAHLLLYSTIVSFPSFSRTLSQLRCVLWRLARHLSS